MPKKLLAPITSKKSKRIDTPKKEENPPNALYSGVTSGRAYLRQSRLPKNWHNNGLKREDECVTYFSQETMQHPVISHEWKPEYSKFILREKYLKPMTKDPYMIKGGLVSRAVEHVVTEAECRLTLIPASSLKTETLNIQTAPTQSISHVVRHLKPNQPSSSGRLLSTPSSMISSALSKVENKRGIKINVNIDGSKTTNSSLTTTGRLLNRPQIYADPSVIRRPPRRLMTNVTHETVLPLSVYG